MLWLLGVQEARRNVHCSVKEHVFVGKEFVDVRRLVVKSLIIFRQLVQVDLVEECRWLHVVCAQTQSHTIEHGQILKQLLIFTILIEHLFV